MPMDTAGRITITQRAPFTSETGSGERSTRANDVMLAPQDAEKFRQYRGKRRNASSHLLTERKKMQARRSATRPMFRPTYICVHLRAYGKSAVPFSQTRWFILDVPLPLNGIGAAFEPSNITLRGGRTQNSISAVPVLMRVVSS